MPLVNGTMIGAPAVDTLSVRTITSNQWLYNVHVPGGALAFGSASGLLSY